MSERRKHSRQMVVETATLTSARSQHLCRLLDISSRGAKIETEMPVFLNGTLQLDSGTISEDVRIVWRLGSLAGVAFRPFKRD